MLFRSHASLRAAGLARIPEDRHREGVVGDLPLWHNAIIEDLGDPRFSRWGWLRKAAAAKSVPALRALFLFRLITTTAWKNHGAQRYAP